LTRQDFDPNNPAHYEQLTRAEAKDLLDNRDQSRWHRVVFWTIAGNTYRVGYGKWSTLHPDDVLPEIHNHMPGMIYVNLTVAEALLLGDEDNLESERSRHRTELTIIATLRKKTATLFKKDGDDEDWLEHLELTPKMRCQIVEVLGIHCSSVQKPSQIEYGTKGGPRITNYQCRLRAVRETKENWKLMNLAEEKFLTEERAKFDVEQSLSQSSGTSGLKTKFRPTGNLKEAHIKVIYTAGTSAALRKKVWMKLLSGEWKLTDLRANLEQETRMNAIFQGIFKATGQTTLAGLKGVYGELFDWQWISDNLLSYFPKKYKATGKFPKGAKHVLNSRVREVELMKKHQQMTSEERSEDRFKSSRFSLTIPVARDKAQDVRENKKTHRYYVTKEVPIFLLYGLKFGLTSKWIPEAIAKHIPEFPADVVKRGMWNSGLMVLNYPWGWTDHDWDTKWTAAQLCTALNNFKGHCSRCIYGIHIIIVLC